MSAIINPKARWREVTGTILKSEVNFDWEDYRPVVEYQYEVDGVSYRGDTIAVGPLVQFNWKGPATRVIERFPVGASVTVYVDPANPRRASLQPSVDRNLPLFLITIGIFALIFVAIVLRACGTS
jgi:hypothetical protein